MESPAAPHDPGLASPQRASRGAPEAERSRWVPAGGARLLGALLALAYPVFVYFGLARLDARGVALLLLALLGLRAALVLGAAARRAELSGAWAALRPLLPAAIVVGAGALLRDERFLLALPVLVSLALLVGFSVSLRGVPVVLRFARSVDPDLSPEEERHCRTVTQVWCGFFALNALLTGALALLAPLAWWTLWTGLLAYLAMGLLFAAEFLVRRARFGRFGSGPHDRVARALLQLAGYGDGAESAPRDWTQVTEKGSELGVRLLLWIALALGRTPLRAVMRVVALYYTATDARLRRVSDEFHARVGAPTGFLAAYRHVRTFAFCSADRIFLLKGVTRHFRIERFGRENGERVRRAGKGGIMIGAHFGSFEALRATAEVDDLPLSIVAYFENATISNAVLQSLDPDLAARVIHVRPGEVGYLLEVRRRVAAGELVAFLGDRSIPGADTIEVEFLGEPAHFPTGALAVAGAIGCPVVLIFGVYREPNRYEMHCEAFADRVEWPRRGGDEAKRALVQRYAERLEHYVRSAPDNWFNFYDFWS